jgi:hypothetical protein
MEERVHGCIRHLVVNLDEVGEDRQSKKSVMLTAMGGQAIHHGVNRNLRHVAVIMCVAASGKHRIPCIITSQESDYFREVLRKKSEKL